MWDYKARLYEWESPPAVPGSANCTLTHCVSRVCVCESSHACGKTRWGHDHDFGLWLHVCRPSRRLRSLSLSLSLSVVLLLYNLHLLPFCTTTHTHKTGRRQTCVLALEPFPPSTDVTPWWSCRLACSRRTVSQVFVTHQITILMACKTQTVVPENPW